MSESDSSQKGTATTDAADGKEDLPAVPDGKADSASAPPTRATGTTISRRSYLVGAAGVASLTAVPAASAAASIQYGENEYGTGGYGGVSL